MRAAMLGAKAQAPSVARGTVLARRGRVASVARPQLPAALRRPTWGCARRAGRNAFSVVADAVPDTKPPEIKAGGNPLVSDIVAGAQNKTN